MFTPKNKIGAVTSFLQQLEKIGKTDNRMFFFRGHSKKEYKLVPSIFRNSGFIDNEVNMLKELILRCPDDFDDGVTTFDALVKMQHYGLPTRLLDVTSNPLVALLFACESHKENDQDGEVIVFSYDLDSVKYFDSDTVAVISNLSRRPADFVIPPAVKNPDSEEAIKKFNKKKEIQLLLHDIANDKPHFLPKIIRDDLKRTICVKPRLDNPRIIRQEGGFLLLGCNEEKSKPAQIDSDSIVARLTIKKESKRDLRDDLNKLGISRGTMFPEIEHVAGHIMDSYFIPTVNIQGLPGLQRDVFICLQNRGALSTKAISEYLGKAPISIGQAIGKLRNQGAIMPDGSGRNKKWKITAKLKIVEPAA